MPSARISLTLSGHLSLSFIASGRSSGLQPVSSLNCCMWVRADRLAFARPCDGVPWSTSLSSSLLLQQCPACLVRLSFVIYCLVSFHGLKENLVGLLLGMGGVKKVIYVFASTQFKKKFWGGVAWCTFFT